MSSLTACDQTICVFMIHFLYLLGKHSGCIEDCLCCQLQSLRCKMILACNIKTFSLSFRFYCRHFHMIQDQGAMIFSRLGYRNGHTTIIKLSEIGRASCRESEEVSG